MMGDGEPPTGTAVEPPEEHVTVARVRDLSTPRARHRFLAVPGGVLLVVAMFLPAMKECGETRYPLETPQLLGPYLLAGVLALVSLLPARIRGYGLRIFALLSLLHYAVLVLALLVVTAQDTDAAGTLLVVLVLGGSVFLVARTAPTVEERAARMAMVQAIQWSLWFAMWNLLEGALIGMRVALAGSLAVTLGAVVWLRDSRTRT
jgi:peptidoglycan/LPS O-acetylase OafA/YrhL